MSDCPGHHILYVGGVSSHGGAGNEDAETWFPVKSILSVGPRHARLLGLGGPQPVPEGLSSPHWGVSLSVCSSSICKDLPCVHPSKRSQHLAQSVIEPRSAYLRCGFRPHACGRLSAKMDSGDEAYGSIESVMPSNHLILCCPLLFLLSVFPSIRARQVPKDTIYLTHIDTQSSAPQTEVSSPCFLSGPPSQASFGVPYSSVHIPSSSPWVMEAGSGSCHGNQCSRELQNDF
ncbi:unnamed protein product [Rangifer tarandus platyrhynchus]|uniref:Uncharacterized protein n=3 Tax=Rangifer tarandus platyrhynchus TaxID=3082113 RepID=A0ABN8YHZ7_RANTA|nr:unnamed protein product [Rangifer tarandus platyrhynchus]CAI9697803.1 unnamed protein product [Rangifer tarandus platyrhynchus]